MEIQDILNLLIWFQILNKYDQKYILVFLKNIISSKSFKPFKIQNFKLLFYIFKAVFNSFFYILMRHTKSNTCSLKLWHE